jgi:hypothetical protein
MRIASRLMLAVLVPLGRVVGAAPGSEAPVLMPPFIVEGQRGEGIEWIYGAGGDLRVLSGCGTDQTAGFLEQIMEQRNALESFIPEEFLLHESLPLTLVLFPKSQKDAMDKILQQELREGTEPAYRQFTPMNDLRLSEPDSSDIFIVFDDTVAKTDVWLGGGAKVHSINYPTPVRSPDYVRFLLQARAPALPDWYVAGCVRLYEAMDFKQAADRAQPQTESDRITVDGNTFGPDPWLSDSDASSLARHPEGPRPLVPMRELFVPRYPYAKSDEYRRVWEAQAELFMRWALSGRIEGGQDRLRRFVEGATTQRTTEEFFFSCFGMDYADALDALSDYLPRAVGRQIFVASGTSGKIPKLELRAATASEVRGVKSEWSRRVLKAISEDNPQALPLFARKVRDTFEFDVAQGERGPDFLASLALFRIQYGDPRDGIRILEQNPGAAAARPVAQLELAQQHLLKALANPEGPKGSLGERQSSDLIREISLSLRAGPIESAYRLAAKVCEHLGRDPTASERTLLADGARLFPRDSALVVQAAAWDLRAGNVAEATSLIEFGLWEGSDPAGREKLVVLDNLARQASTVVSLQGRGR